MALDPNINIRLFQDVVDIGREIEGAQKAGDSQNKELTNKIVSLANKLFEYPQFRAESEKILKFKDLKEARELFSNIGLSILQQNHGLNKQSDQKNLSAMGKVETISKLHLPQSIEIDTKSAKEAYLLATEIPNDSHVAVGILRPDGVSLKFNLGENVDNGVQRIGSVTKTFTAFLALKLVNDGVITLKTSLGDLVDKNLIDKSVLQGVFTDPEMAKRMTLEQLLSHTSGLEYDDRPLGGINGEDQRVKLPTLHERFIFQGTLNQKYRHEHQPGDGVGLYSNIGFDVAALMLEVAYNAGKEPSKSSFSKIMKDELFTNVFHLSEETRVLPGPSGDGDVIQAGCGDMVSSVDDLLTVAKVLQKGEKHLSSYFGEGWQKMMMDSRGSDGTCSYGLGCEANASSIQFSGLNFEIFKDRRAGRDVTAHVAFPLQEGQPGIVAMSDSNALGPSSNQVKFRQELRKLAGLSII